MAEATRQQKMDAVLAGTFDRLDPNARIQPGYTLAGVRVGYLDAACDVDERWIARLSRAVDKERPDDWR